MREGQECEQGDQLWKLIEETSTSVTEDLASTLSPANDDRSWREMFQPKTWVP